ncbi:hypothetical protein MXB_2192, partial [Myxobolus squamalis]
TPSQTKNFFSGIQEKNEKLELFFFAYNRIEKRAMKELWQNFNPLSIFIEFELAAIGDEGFLRRYIADPDFALAARVIVAISFFQIKYKEIAIKVLKKIGENRTQILNWFEDGYIGRQNCNRTQRSALFPPDMSFVYEKRVNRGILPTITLKQNIGSRKINWDRSPKYLEV